MNLKENLMRYIDAGCFPIIFIKSNEELKTDEIIRNLDTGRKIYEWNGANGYVNFDTKIPFTSSMQRLDELLSDLCNGNELNNAILVIKDSRIYLNDNYPGVSSLLKYISHRILLDQLNSTIIIVSPEVSIPKDIENLVTVFEMDEMNSEDIENYIRQCFSECGINTSEKMINELTLAFKGLSENEIGSLINLALSSFEGTITRDSLKLIIEQKRQIIMKNNILEMIPVNEKLSDIGGLQKLKVWLERKSKVFKDIDEAIRFGVDMPKGVLIAGIPGCGKSLSAKVTAGLLEVPLLKLDMGKIMGKYLGESETNMRKAIKLAETIAPCVLWVDELEKAFAGTDGSGHEVTIRLFGTFLTWLQEKESPVFVVATANDISKMPPELLRKGRFDDIFYVDLPNDDERSSIFEIHIKKRRKHDFDSIDIRKLVNLTKGFSGADIEGVVVDAVEDTFADGQQQLTTEYLEKAIRDTKSLSVIMKEQLDQLRKFYKEKSHFKSAT